MKKRSADVVAALVWEEQRLMDEEDKLSSRVTLSSWEKVERIKKETAQSKNALETYIQFVKNDGVLGNDALRTFLTSEEASQISDTVSSVSDWYEEGDGAVESCTKEEFDKKLELLKNVTEAPLERFKALQNVSADGEKNVEKRDKKSKRPQKKKKRSSDAADADAANTGDQPDRDLANEEL